ncbi:MAG: hypothetical protein ACIRZ1_00295 [Ligilactobacillus ruminis]
MVELAKDKVCVTYSESLLEKNPLAKFRLKVATKCLGWLRRYNFVKLLKNFEVGY